MWCFRWDFCHGLNGVRQIIECAIPPTNRLIYFVLETVVCPTSWPIHHIQHIAKPPNSWSGATVRAWPQEGSEWYKFDVTTAFRKLSDETTATKSIPKYKRDVAVSTSRTFDDSIRRMTQSGGGPFLLGSFWRGSLVFSVPTTGSTYTSSFVGAGDIVPTRRRELYILGVVILTAGLWKPWLKLITFWL